MYKKNPGNFVIKNMIRYLEIANWILGIFALDNPSLREEVWTELFLCRFFMFKISNLKQIVSTQQTAAHSLSPLILEVSRC